MKIAASSLLLMIATSFATASSSLRGLATSKCKTMSLVYDVATFTPSQLDNGLRTLVGEAYVVSSTGEQLVLGRFGQTSQALNDPVDPTNDIIAGHFSYYKTLGDANSGYDASWYFEGTKSVYDQTGELAIVGGTGKYACATGVIKLTGSEALLFAYDLVICDTCNPYK